jgi:hypothetical protein
MESAATSSVQVAREIEVSAPDWKRSAQTPHQLLIKLLKDRFKIIYPTVSAICAQNRHRQVALIPFLSITEY